MRRLIALFALGSVFGCETTRYSVAKAPQTSAYAVVIIGDSAGYLIDPRTETCFLWSVLSVSSMPIGAGGSVDCAKLKASVPEAAKYITWGTLVSQP